MASYVADLDSYYQLVAPNRNQEPALIEMLYGDEADFSKLAVSLAQKIHRREYGKAVEALKEVSGVGLYHLVNAPVDHPEKIELIKSCVQAIFAARPEMSGFGLGISCLPPTCYSSLVEMMIANGPLSRLEAGKIMEQVKMPGPGKLDIINYVRRGLPGAGEDVGPVVSMHDTCRLRIDGTDLWHLELNAFLPEFYRAHPLARLVGTSRGLVYEPASTVEQMVAPAKLDARWGVQSVMLVSRSFEDTLAGYAAANSRGAKRDEMMTALSNASGPERAELQRRIDVSKDYSPHQIYMVHTIELAPDDVMRVMQVMKLAQASYERGVWPTFGPLTGAANCGTFVALMACCSGRIARAAPDLATYPMDRIVHELIDLQPHIQGMKTRVPTVNNISYRDLYAKEKARLEPRSTSELHRIALNAYKHKALCTARPGRASFDAQYRGPFRKQKPEIEAASKIAVDMLTDALQEQTGDQASARRP